MLDGAADFDQLPAGGAEAVDAPFGVEWKVVLPDEAAGMFDNAAAIHPAERSRFLAPQKNVLCHAHVRSEQRFLMHHGDADGGGFGRRAQKNFLAVPEHAAGVAL